MSAIVDIDILLRAMTIENASESSAAQTFLQSNDIVIPDQAFCEMVWVLRRLYKRSGADLIKAVRTWMSVEIATLDRPAVEASLAFLEAGGDFADGVIEFEGRRLNGETFATFDRRAAATAAAKGRQSVLLAAE